MLNQSTTEVTAEMLSQPWLNGFEEALKDMRSFGYQPDAVVIGSWGYHGAIQELGINRIFVSTKIPPKTFYFIRSSDEPWKTLLPHLESVLWCPACERAHQ